MGLGGCFIGAINKDKLRQELNIAPELTILLIIALGEPAEEVVIESTADTNGNIRYWRGEDGIHHVPKEVVKTALQATRLIGDGLYGVDLKLTHKGPVIIEINDNPSIESGVEDLLIGDELYHIIMRDFARRLDEK